MDNFNNINNLSFLSNSKDIILKEVMELDLETIIELINTMKLYENKYNEAGLFREALLVKEKISCLKTCENNKRNSCLSQKFDNKKLNHNKFQSESLNKFNKNYDNLFYNLNNKFIQDEYNMLTSHKNEINILIKDIEDFYNNSILKYGYSNCKKVNEVSKIYTKRYSLPKPSHDFINKLNQLDNLKKLKNYNEAIVVKKELDKIANIERAKFNKIKLNKIEKEVSNLKKIHDKQYNSLKNKFIQKYNELKRERALQLDKLIYKFKIKKHIIEYDFNNEKLKIFDSKNSTNILGLNNLEFSKIVNNFNISNNLDSK